MSKISLLDLDKYEDSDPIEHIKKKKTGKMGALLRFYYRLIRNWHTWYSDVEIKGQECGVFSES